KKKSMPKPALEEPLDPPTMTQFNPLPVLQHARDLVRLQREARVRQNKFIERLSQRQFRRFLDSIPSLIVHIVQNQNVRFCNKSSAAFFGLAAQQAIGIPLWELFLPADYDAMRPSLLEAIGGSEATFEQELQGQQRRHFLATVTPDCTSENV